MVNYSIRVFFIFILFTGFLFYSAGCKYTKLDDPGSLIIGDVLSIKPGSNQVKANGVDKVKITATLEGDTPDGKEVVFKTDTGTFASIPGTEGTSSSQQQIEIKAVNKQAEVFLVSSIEVKNANISASVENFTVFTIIEFVRVFPVRIYLTSNVTVAKANGQDTATLTAALIPPENKGTVSKGARVLFDAIDLNTGAAVPQLHREALSDKNGKATAQFTCQQPGRMQITCKIEGASDIDHNAVIVNFIEEEEEEE